MYEKILVPLSGSKLGECVLPHVEKLAKDYDVKEIVLLRVCEAPTIPSDYPASMSRSWEQHVDQVTTGARQQCSLYLRGIEERLGGLGPNVRSESRLGNAADEIVDYASKSGVDLIVFASHGRSELSRWAFGSVTDKVFRSTCVPILMVRGPGCGPGV